jgi:hypothetical protein
MQGHEQTADFIIHEQLTAARTLTSRFGGLP